MPAELVDARGSAVLEPTGPALEDLARRADFFWLELHGVSEAELELVGHAFDFHALALEDARDFGQRPKVEPYDEFVFLTVYGAAPDEDDLVEVHCFLSERFLITVRRDECPAFAQARAQLARRSGDFDEPALVLYRVLDGLVDSFFPLLSELDDRIDALEAAILTGPGDPELQEALWLKRRLVALRKVVAPERDLLAALLAGGLALPGMSLEAERHFRDVYDHLIRLGDTLDGYRDVLTGVMEVYLSTTSNRLNVVMKQLAVIATIFLPLTFITGFFGQNFPWLVENVGGLAAFVAWGIGLQLATLVMLLAFFRRRGWF